jgi:hypothetical protein
LPERDEADDEPQASAATREEPQFFAKSSSRPQAPPSAERAEPQLQSPAPAPQSTPLPSSLARYAGAERDDRDKLRTILDELRECRRVLEAAMTADSPADV